MQLLSLHTPEREPPSSEAAQPGGLHRPGGGSLGSHSPSSGEEARWGGQGRCRQPPEQHKALGAPALAPSQGRSLGAADPTMRAPGCCCSRSCWGQMAALLLLLLGAPPRGLALPPIRYSHAGICPNDMNPNLWVDAQSTCKRECETDQVSVNPEA